MPSLENSVVSSICLEIYLFRLLKQATSRKARKIAAMKFLACLVLILVYATNEIGFCARTTGSDFIEKLQKYNATTIPFAQDTFCYINDDGVVIKAQLKGGPRAATPDQVKDGVEFFLLRSGNGNHGEIRITPGCTDCLEKYIPGAKLLMISHGFASTSQGAFGDNYRYSLAQQSETFNVIFINWEKLAMAPWYGTAVDNVKPVGEYAASLLNFLIERNVSSLDKIHFIGHSLGSHVGNHVGRNVVGGKIARLTALDPALPLFKRKGDSDRIDPTDAIFVDVIHTSAPNHSLASTEFGLGFSEPRGHVDFYPNSGRNQPACSVLQEFLVGACSHSIANIYYAESMNHSSDFVGYKCTSWKEYTKGQCKCDESLVMGWTTYNESKRGRYYLKTGAEPIYGQGDVGCSSSASSLESGVVVTVFRYLSTVSVVIYAIYLSITALIKVF